jgi:hypothetical protein
MQKIDRLIQLNQGLDGIIEFRDNDNDTLGNAARWGGGAALGVGGLKLYQGIRKKQAGMPQTGPQLELPGMETKPSFGQAARSYVSDLPGIAEGRAKQGWSAVKNLFGKLRGAV